MPFQASSVPAESGASVCGGLHVLAKQHAVHDACHAVVVDLVRPGAQLAHLGAVGLAGLPVGDESDAGDELLQIDAAAEVDEADAFACPAVSATREVSRAPVGFHAGVVEADKDIVAFEITVDDLLGVQGLDGAEQLDGQPHRHHLVHAASGGAGTVGASDVDEIEQGALVPVLLDQEALVAEHMHFMSADDTLCGSRDTKSAMRLLQDEELPGRERLFHLDRLQWLAVRKCTNPASDRTVLVFGRLRRFAVFYQVDRCEGASAELPLDSVRRLRALKLQDWRQ